MHLRAPSYTRRWAFVCVDHFTALALEGDEILAVVGRSGIARIAREANGEMTYLDAASTAGRAFAVVATGDSIFAGEEGGLVVFPRAAARDSEPLWFDPDGHGMARSVVVRGSTAWVAASMRGLQTFSLADPNAPVLLDRDDSTGSLQADIADTRRLLAWNPPETLDEGLARTVKETP